MDKGRSVQQKTGFILNLHNQTKTIIFEEMFLMESVEHLKEMVIDFFIAHGWIRHFHLN